MKSLIVLAVLVVVVIFGSLVPPLWFAIFLAMVVLWFASWAIGEVVNS